MNGLTIKNRDDLVLLHSLCDLAVRQHGLNTNPRVHKMAADIAKAISDMPEVPMPMSKEDLAKAERAKKTVDEANGERL